MLRQPFGVELQEARRGLQRVVLRIFVELPEARRVILPVQRGLVDVGLFLVEVLPGGEFVHLHGVEHDLLEVESRQSSGELLTVTELVGNRGYDLVVALRLADG